MEDKKMVTDMNDRERERFSQALKLMSVQIDALTAALDSGNDTALGAPSLMFMLAFDQLRDLFSVIATAHWVDVSDLDRPMPEEEA